MSRCENCFDSTVIHNYIIKNGSKLSAKTECTLCGHHSEYEIEEYILGHKIKDIIHKIYEHESEHGLVGSASMFAEKSDSIDMYLPMSKSLANICKELFDISYENNDFYNLLSPKTKHCSGDFADPYAEVWINMGCEWSDEYKMRLDWKKFSENVKYKARFFDNSSYSRINELSSLNIIFSELKRTITLQLYRTRECNSEKKFNDIKSNPSGLLGKAPEQFAGYNRFSPAGISYIYLSEDKKTAMQEIRVSKNDRVAIGKFGIENKALIDLRKNTLENIISDPFSANFTAEIHCNIELLKNFISDITKKVSESDKLIDYVPTQILAEYIRSLGYEGFIFDSSLCDGINYVLFEDKGLNYIDYEIKNSN